MRSKFAAKCGVMFRNNAMQYAIKIAAILLLTVTLAQADEQCVVTEEYELEKWELTKQFSENRNDCINSVSQSNYWYATWQCLEAAKGSIEKEKHCLINAAHKANQYKKINVNEDICNPFYRDSEFFKRALNVEVERKGIRKCE